MTPDFLPFYLISPSLLAAMGVLPESPTIFHWAGAILCIWHPYYPSLNLLQLYSLFGVQRSGQGNLANKGESFWRWMLWSVEKRNAHSFTENVSFVTYLVECPIWAVRWALSWWRGCKHLVKRPWRFWWLLKFATRGNRKQQPGKRENSSQNMNPSHCLLAIQNSGNTPDVFCYNFNLGNIFVRSNNTNKMPERSIESILLTSLITKEYFVPGGSLFWKVYQRQTFFCLPPTISLSYKFLVQVVESLQNSWTV